MGTARIGRFALMLRSRSVTALRPLSTGGHRLCAWPVTGGSGTPLPAGSWISQGLDEASGLRSRLHCLVAAFNVSLPVGRRHSLVAPSILIPWA